MHDVPSSSAALNPSAACLLDGDSALKEATFPVPPGPMKLADDEKTPKLLHSTSRLLDDSSGSGLPFSFLGRPATYTGLPAHAILQLLAPDGTHRSCCGPVKERDFARLEAQRPERRVRRRNRDRFCISIGRPKVQRCDASESKLGPPAIHFSLSLDHGWEADYTSNSFAPTERNG